MSTVIHGRHESVETCQHVATQLVRCVPWDVPAYKVIVSSKSECTDLALCEVHFRDMEKVGRVRTSLPLRSE